MRRSIITIACSGKVTVNGRVLVMLTFWGIVLTSLLHCKNIMIQWTRKSESTLQDVAAYKRKGPCEGA
jgi:hypothetical protein